jgi:Uma2 family endonuclease
METVLVQSEYELERGKPVPSKNHAIVQGNIYFLLRQKYESTYRFVTEVSILMHEKERIPDLAIYEQLEFTPGNDEVRLETPPLAAVEILSPTQSLADLIAKSYRYFEAGVKSYWLVLPDLTSIYVFSAPNEYEVFAKKGTLKDTQLNIELDLEAIFK